MSFSLKKIPSQKGRIAIVTGANVGLGYETALAFARKEIKVIMACRNAQKAEKAKADILAQVPNAELEIIILDLNSLQSVRDFAKTYTEKYDRLDLLINNAGLMVPPLMRTEEGFESQFGVNHLGHFLLTNLLFPHIRKTEGSRVVSLSSNAHKRAEINFDDLNSEKSYSKIGAYSQSKLACLMFAYELQRRLDAAGSHVLSVAAHPGASDTDLARYISKLLYYALLPLFSLVTHSPEKGALPTIYAALGNDVDGGDYFGPQGFMEMKGEPGKVESKPQSHDKEVAKKLWEVSEKLTGEKFEIK